MKARMTILVLICSIIFGACASRASRETQAEQPGSLSETNLVRMKENSFCNAGGPFLGLGASYFQALHDAKYNRSRLNANLAFLASKGFNYVRVFSMVSWEGLEFTAFCNNKPNRYWPDVSSPTDGCVRNIGGSKGNEFVCLPMGILPGGVKLEARRDLRFEVFNPLTGASITNRTLNAGKAFTLLQGPGAYITKAQ